MMESIVDIRAAAFTPLPATDRCTSPIHRMRG
jgi:hypothetical protein